MPRWFARSLALVLCMVFIGCESLEKHSFESFQPSPAQEAATVRSDLLALQYADSVARLLERRGTASRITSEVSDSALVTAGALAAAYKTLGIAADTVAQAAVGVVVLKELQGIFNARGRSEAFTDAAYLIRQAQSEFRQHNPNASENLMTENGAILISRVNAALHAARKTLNGRMPGLRDLEQATQKMTAAGATRTSATGVPRTLFNAAGDKPGDAAVGPSGATPEQVNAAVNRAVAEMTKTQERLVKEQKTQPLTPTEAQAKIDSLTSELSGTTELARVQKFHRDIIGETLETDIDVLKNTLNEKLRATRNKAASTDAAEKADALANVTQYLRAFGR